MYKYLQTDTIGIRISNLRNEQNMKQSDLAATLSELLGRSIQFTTVSSWETGRRKPAFDVIQKMSQLFGCSVDYILGNTDDRNGVAEEPETEKIDTSYFIRAEVKLKPSDILKNRNFDGRPVYITFKNYIHANQWALVNLKNEMLVLSDGRMLKIDAPSIEFIYTDIPTYESCCSINGNYPLDLVRLKKKTGEFYVEMITPDKEISAAYNGWYKNDKDHTCIINSIGRVLPYTGLGISYNAYSTKYKQDLSNR